MITSKEYKIKKKPYTKRQISKSQYKLYAHIKKQANKSSIDLKDLEHFKRLLSVDKIKYSLVHKKTGMSATAIVPEPQGKDDLINLLKVIKKCEKKIRAKLQVFRKKQRRKRIRSKIFYGVKLQKVGGVYEKPGTFVNFLRKDPRNDAFRMPEPVFKHKRYVGIELEFEGDSHDTIERRKLKKALEKKRLGKYCNIDSDHCGFEIQILLPEKDVYNKLRSIVSTITNLGYSGTRNCGAHVHLDMRKRDVHKCYRNLFKMQKLLYKLVPKERRTNRFCQPNRYDTFQMQHTNAGGKYWCINTGTYNKLKTLEVRLHHGSLNYSELHEWIKVLIKTVDMPEIKVEPNNVEELSKVLKLRKKEKIKIENRYKKFNEVS